MGGGSSRCRWNMVLHYLQTYASKQYLPFAFLVNLGPKGYEIIVMPLVCVLLEDKGAGTGCMILIVLMCQK